MEFKAKVELNLDDVVDYLKKLPTTDFHYAMETVYKRYYDENRTIINPFLEAAYNNLDCEVRYRMNNNVYHFAVYIEHYGEMYNNDGTYNAGNNQWCVTVDLNRSCILYDKVDHVIRYGTPDESISKVLGTVDEIELDYYATSGYIHLIARNYATDKQTRTFDTIPYYVLDYARNVYGSIVRSCMDACGLLDSKE